MGSEMCIRDSWRVCERADRQCHSIMIQKQWEFGELESLAHIVHKGEDLLKKKGNSKTGRGKTI